MMKKLSTSTAITLSVVFGFVISATVVTALTVLMASASVGTDGASLFVTEGLEFGTVVRHVATDGSSTASMTFGPLSGLLLVSPPIIFGLITFARRQRPRGSATVTTV